jgi:hypothetical protein
MRNVLCLLVVVFSLSSCELIVIGQKPTEVKTIIVSRKNPTGTVMLLKSELKNNNYFAASDFFASASGHKFKANEKLELYDQLPMLRNKINLLSDITSITEEKQSNDIVRVKIEYNYINFFVCDTKKIDSLYYVINYGFHKYNG